MGTLNSKFVIESLRQLQKAQPDIFGSNVHAFELNPPLAEADVVAFETQYTASLPPEYRQFITEIGNGGAGPYYGVFPLGKMDASVGEGLQPWAGVVGELSQAFPHHEAWNDLVDQPDSKLMDLDEDDYNRRLDVFDESYWGTQNVNGAIPICHKGCALRVWLVVAGKEAGHLWDDDRADYKGLRPTLLKSGERATFSGWYSEWLVNAVEALS